MALIIILLVIIIILYITVICISDGENIDLIAFAIFIILTASILFGFILNDKFSIDPIEVYRGNTTLKVTGEYKDSIFVPTDTIVIMKNDK